MKLGWVDFDEKSLKLAKDIMSALDQPGARDYLGLGVVRDRISDYLFPGTSVLMKGAGYFFLVPKAIRDYQKIAVKSQLSVSQLETSIYEIEKRQAIRLQKDFPKMSFIGASNLKRSKQTKFVEILPSDAYWVGLQKFNIIPTTKNKNSFLRDLANPINAGKSWCDLSNENLDNMSITLKLGIDESLYLIKKISMISYDGEKFPFPPLLSCLPQYLDPYKEEGHIEFPWDIKREGLNLDNKAWKHYSSILNEAKVISHLICIAFRAYGHNVSEMPNYVNSIEAANAKELFKSKYEILREVCITGKILSEDFANVNNLFLDAKFRSGMSFLKIIGNLVVENPTGRQFLLKSKNIIKLQEFKSKPKRHLRLTPLAEEDTNSMFHSSQWNGVEMARLVDYRWPTVRRILHDICIGAHG